MSDNNKQIDVYFIRRGETQSDVNGLTSAVESNQPLTAEATKKTTELNNVYKALIAEEKISEDTPIHTGHPQSLVATAANFMGQDREEADKHITFDSSLNKRYKYEGSSERGRTWEGVITKRLDREIGDLIEARQSRKAHRQKVTDALELTKTVGESPSETPSRHIINKDAPKAQIVVAHSSTVSRLMEHFEGAKEEEKNNKLIEGAVVHHAHSNDGGKTWKVTRVELDEKGKTQETELKERPKNNEIGLEKILKTHRTTISTNKDGTSTLAVKFDNRKTSTMEKNQVADDLGKLLIGNHYQDEQAVKTNRDSVEVVLDKTQTEIVKAFAKLKKIEIPENSRQIG